jgi:hypothetical protein
MVREQVNRLIETHHFKNSKRYPALLRFIVEETLEGRGEFLKERLLGVRVFDRPPDYDTAADPIVRVTIAEIRKRIAQYYHEEEHDAEMRIELLPGHYVPEFRARLRKDGTGELTATGSRVANSSAGNGHFRVDPTADAPPIATAAAPQPVAEIAAVAPLVSPALPAAAGRSLRTLWWSAAVVSALLLGAWWVPLLNWLQPTALDRLWSPLLASSHSVLFCVPTDVGVTYEPVGVPGDANGSKAQIGLREHENWEAGGPTFRDYEVLGENVVYSDMLAALDIAKYLAANHRDYHTRSNVDTTLEDLRQGPVVLIGGLDNQWTLRALAPLRYRFAGSDQDRYWIQDSKAPLNKRWSLDLKQHYSAVTRDYAIIARLHNQQTGQPELVVAGIGMSGTAAAGEFIGDEHRLKELSQRIGPGFKSRDFEVVLSTDVVNGIAGAPQIIATTSW